MCRTLHAARQTRTRGNTVIEFSLLFLLFWILVSGCFRVAYPAYVYSSLAGAVDGGARYAARVPFDAPTHTFVTKVANMAAYGSPNGSGAALAPGLTASNISVTWTTDTSGAPVTMRVAITGYSVNALFQTFTFSGKPAVTVRYAGTYKP
jgi:Flp pilus assembly protein TadG